MNNDLIEGDSAFCQHMETLLVKALAEINSVLKYWQKCAVNFSKFNVYYTEQKTNFTDKYQFNILWMYKIILICL